MSPSAPTPRRRRSALFVPGANPRALAKVPGLGADVVIIDLEDAVARGDKVAARDAATDLVGRQALAGREVLVRVNGTASGLLEDDLRRIVPAGPDGVLLPKVQGPGDLALLADVVDDVRSSACGGGPGLWAMIETPAGVLAAASIAACDGVVGLVVGTNDLAAGLGTTEAPGRQPLVTALSLCVLGARAAGRVVLDGPFGDLDDPAGLHAECRQARSLGFDGKTLIHPGQIEICHDAFRADADELARARAVVDAWEAAGAEGGAIAVDGHLVEELHVERARRLLADEDPS